MTWHGRLAHVFNRKEEKTRARRSVPLEERNCDVSECEFDQHLDAYYDGELSDERSREVEAHVQSCAACAAALAGMRRVPKGGVGGGQAGARGERDGGFYQGAPPRHQSPGPRGGGGGTAAGRA